MNRSELNKADELCRRQFLINSAHTYLGVSVAPMIGAGLTSSLGAQGTSGRTNTADHVIFLNMGGGMSHLDTFDTKPQNKEIQGPVESVATSGDFQISQYLSKMFAAGN